ncbi:short-chain dehydrogenase [Aeromicrobium sp. A1-2]|uniref:SDR family oxidoreductase n=1 Tax=Aeromicrobium sp. A1-2 TaxID=2107713 RepID=UPI000E4FA7F5|nr:SDR family oxidoreductase [Aeromicrobium sp. A1-2]AXT86526.1 short-chain dehydrogenase [Aeromicrobium sp. A1-2]
MPRLTSLDDQIVVITGAGRGIGLATATQFAAAGAIVVIGDLDDDVAAKAALQIGGRAVGHVVDVADRASYARFIEFAATLGPIDILVNNAGIMPLSALVDETDQATDRILDINLRGVITGTKLVAPDMIARGRGHIINVASAVGRIAVANGATYSASKFAVVGFSEAMQSELAPAGIDVSCVLPTVVATELAAGVAATKGMRAVEPGEVARAIIKVARRPRFETWVPGWSKGLFYTMNTLPRRVRNAAGHAIGADQALSKVDAAARNEYERRAGGHSDA